MPEVVPEQVHAPAGGTGAGAQLDPTAPGPGETELCRVLEEPRAPGSAPVEPGRIADIFRKFPAEHARLTELVQGALGNQFMLQVLTQAPATTPGAAPTAAPPVSVAGPGLVALAKLIVGGGDSDPEVDAVIAVLDQYPGEHEALVAALGTYLGDDYVTQVGARMPHLRVHWKELHLVAGDPNSPTGNFLEAGKELEGGRFRLGMGSGTYSGTFGGDVGHDVSATWKNGNFLRASEKLDGAEWKFGKLTGKARGDNIDAQYAFTDVKALRLHYNSKTSLGTLGFYRSGKLRGPELAARYKSGNDYSVGLQRQFGMGEGVTGTLGARHMVDANLGVGDPTTKLTADKTREALTFDAVGKSFDAHMYAGLHPDGQFTAGLSGATNLGPKTRFSGAFGLDGDDAKVSTTLSHAWKQGLSSSANFTADPTGLQANLSTAYGQRTDGSGLTMSAMLQYIDKTDQQPMWNAAVVQKYVGKNIIESLSLNASLGETNQFTADASVDLRLHKQLFASAFGRWSLMSPDSRDSDLGGQLVFTPSSKTAIKVAFMVNGAAEYETMVEFAVLKRALKTVKDYSDQKYKQVLSVFATYGDHGPVSMFDRTFGAPTRSMQIETDAAPIIMLGVRIHL